VSLLGEAHRHAERHTGTLPDLSGGVIQEQPRKGLSYSGAARNPRRWASVPGPEALATRLLQRVGIRSCDEFNKVGLFMLAAFLSNAFFVAGRNVSTVLFLKYVSMAHLPVAMFVSGTLTVLIGYWFSWQSRGASAAVVNRWLIVGSIVLIGTLYVGTFWFFSPTDADPFLVMALSFAIYCVEDILAMFVAMQCATVAQSAFSVTDAKRLFGLVQLGNSVAAMVVGVSIGPLAVSLGTENILALQVVVLASYFLANERVERLHPNAINERGAKVANVQPKQVDTRPWWRNLLVLAMGFWSFAVMFVKTMFEYEYNVLVKEALSDEEMVALTGYLYAGAGLISTFVNLVGSKACLDVLGMRGAILATPGCLLVVSLAVLLSPSVSTTFAGRLVDLSLRWSINNTVKSVLWIAVPTTQAVAAKPWVEGTIKKLASASNALVISLVLVASGGSMDILSVLSLLVTAILLLLCLKVYSLYLQSMWMCIRRREFKGLAGAAWSARPFGDDPNMMQRVLNKLLYGGTSQQLYLVREIGEGLNDSIWEQFFSHFARLSVAVQVEIIELGRKQRFRVPDTFLLGLLRDPATTPALLTAVALAVGERGMHDSIGLLQALLDSPTTSVRAAAASAVLRIGWGVGLGAASTRALLVMHDLLGFPLQGVLLPNQASGLPHDESECTDVDVRSGWDRLATALEMLQHLPAPRSLIGNDTWLELLQHPWHLVRVAALAFVREIDFGQGCSQVEISAIVRCLCSPDTYAAAEAALRRLRATLPVQSEVMKHIGLAVEDHMRLAAREEQARRGCFRGDDDCKFSTKLHAEDPSVAPIACMAGLLKFIRQQSSSCWKADLPKLLGSDICDQFMLLYGKLSDSDACRELLSVLVDLNSQGFKFTRELAEAQVRSTATRICNGLNVKQWLKKLGDITSARATELSSYLAFPLPEVAVGKGLHGGNGDNVSSATKKVDLVLQIACRYVTEHIYVLRLQLLHLAVLAAGAAATSAQSTTVLAHWRALRSSDAASKSAALEVLDSMLPLTLKRIVLPLLDPSAIDKKLGVGASLWSEELKSADGAPPEKMLRWFRSRPDRLGMELGVICGYLMGAAPSPPSPPPSDFFAQKLVLLWPVKQSEDLLASHVAEIAAISSIVELRRGEELCRPYETYVVASGVFQCRRSGRLFCKGSVVQELHAFSEELQVSDVVCLSPEGGTAVRIEGRDMFETMLRLPPKFALGLLKSLLRILPAPAQTGGTRAQRMSPGGLQKSTSPGARRQLLMSPAVVSTSLGTRECLPTSPALGCKQAAAHWEHSISPTSPADALARLLASPMYPASPELHPPRCRIKGGAPISSNGLRPPVAVKVMLDDQVGDDIGANGCDEGEQLVDVDDTTLLEIWQSAESRERRPGFGARPAEDEVAEDTEASLEASGRALVVGEEPQLSSRPREGCKDSHSPFSMLEKLVLLQAVKMFRYLPLEHLPSIASCCTPCFHAAGTIIFREGAPTNATLYIVADGVVELSHSGKVERRMRASESMGNTALLLDHRWQYSASAFQDAWVLCLNRNDLTDVLRGRRELASAVIRGLYRTFTRRMQLHQYAVHLPSPATHGNDFESKFFDLPG